MLWFETQIRGLLSSIIGDILADFTGDVPSGIIGGMPSGLYRHTQTGCTDDIMTGVRKVARNGERRERRLIKELRIVILDDINTALIRMAGRLDPTNTIRQVG